MTAKNVDRRCKALAKSGKPCRAAATEGGLCFFHANPDKASELGRIGGRSNRHVATENADPPPSLDNALAVRDTVARLIADVYAGKINPRIATGLAPLLNLQLRAIETTDQEGRLAKLEKLSAEAEDRLKTTASPPMANSISERMKRAELRLEEYQRSTLLEQTGALASVPVCDPAR
jgi:hypothetical protein